MPERDRRRPGAAGRRRLLKSAAAGLFALELPLANGTSVVAVRVWPSSEYTRVTIELDQPLEYSQFVIGNPERVVIDLAGVAVDSALRELVAKVIPSDPYIAHVRVGQFNRETMRLVFDVKQPVKPQVFTLEPVAQYRHRLVIDLYPTRAPDPLELLIAQTEALAIMRELQRGQPTARPALGQRAPAAAASPTSPAPGLPEAATDPILALAARAGGLGPAAARPAVPPATGAERPGGDAQARAGTGRPARRPVVSRLVTIAIDPGHGGEDPGAIGRRGTQEKDVVLAIALKLKERLAAEPNMRAFLTRDGDYFVPLATRVSKARGVQADLFVSIHADAFVEPDAAGSSVFVLSERGASSVEARWLANRENGADRIGGVNLKARNREAAQLLLEMFTRTQIRDSRRLGLAMLEELGDIGRLHKPRVEQASFAVLKAPDMASILVETAFISNPDEERKLRDPRFQDRVAAALMTGIRNYFVKHPPPPLPRGRSA